MRRLSLSLCLVLLLCSCTKKQALWGTFLTTQVIDAGRINYQQEQGLYEINPVYHVFGDRHPSKEQVYLVKGVETGMVWAATKVFPKYEEEILGIAIGVQFGFYISDETKGVSFGLRF